MTHSRVLRTLHNPRYAGAFAYGQRRTRKNANGKTTTRAMPREQWMADPGRPPGIHHLRAIRAEPQDARRQRDRARHRPLRRPSPRRPGAAPGPRDLRPLRPTDDRPLSRPRRDPRPRLPVHRREHPNRCRPLPGDPRSGRRRRRDREAAARHRHTTRARGRARRSSRTRSTRRASRPAPAHTRRARPPTRRTRPPPIPRRRPRQPTRRRHTRSRLERRAPRAPSHPRRIRPPNRGRQHGAHRPAQTADPSARDGLPGAVERPRDPGPGTQTDRPPADRRRDPQQNRSDPPPCPLPRRADHHPDTPARAERLGSPPDPSPTRSPRSIDSSTTTPTPKSPPSSTKPAGAPAPTSRSPEP